MLVIDSVILCCSHMLPKSVHAMSISRAVTAMASDSVNMALARSTLRRWSKVTFSHNQSRWSSSFRCFHVIRDGFRWWWYRTANTLLERRWKTKYVDSYIKQVLSRHSFDLWYLDNIHGVSRRAKQALGCVRRWQRDAAWSSRVESLSKFWLIHDAFHVWFDDTDFMVPLQHSSSEGAFAGAVEYVYEDSSSSDTSEFESTFWSNVRSRGLNLYFRAMVSSESRSRRRR